MAVKTQEGEIIIIGPLKIIATEGIAHIYPLVIPQMDMGTMLAKIIIGPIVMGEIIIETTVGVIIITAEIVDHVTIADKWDTSHGNVPTTIIIRGHLKLGVWKFN